MTVLAKLGLFALAALATFGVTFAAGAAVDPVGLSNSDPAEVHDDDMVPDHGDHWGSTERVIVSRHEGTGP